MLVAFPRIQTKWIHPLTCFRVFASLACHRLLSASFPVLGDPACAPKSKDVNRVWTWCKPKMYGLHGDGFHVKIRKLGSAKRVCNRLCQIWLDYVYTRHLGGLGPIEQISVLTRLATALQPARGIWTGSYLAHSSFDARCTRHASVSWNQTFFFFDFWCAKDDPIFHFFNHWA